MSGKVWFITGASRGFGRVWAEAALERGDRVAATARSLESVADLTERFGNSVLPLALDVTDPTQVERAIAQAHGRFAMIDDGFCFQLVPRSLSLEKQRGCPVSGIARGDSGIDWALGRKRGLGL